MVPPDDVEQGSRLAGCRSRVTAWVREIIDV